MSRRSHVTHLEPLGAAGRGSEDVESVHGAEDEMRSVPGLAAGPAPQPQRPPLQTAHAHRRQVLHAVVVPYLWGGGEGEGVRGPMHTADRYCTRLSYRTCGKGGEGLYYMGTKLSLREGGGASEFREWGRRVLDKMGGGSMAV